MLSVEVEVETTCLVNDISLKYNRRTHPLLTFTLQRGGDKGPERERMSHWALHSQTQ